MTIADNKTDVNKSQKEDANKDPDHKLVNWRNRDQGRHNHRRPKTIFKNPMKDDSVVSVVKAYLSDWKWKLFDTYQLKINLHLRIGEPHI